MDKPTTKVKSGCESWIKSGEYDRYTYEYIWNYNNFNVGTGVDGKKYGLKRLFSNFKEHWDANVQQQRSVFDDSTMERKLKNAVLKRQVEDNTMTLREGGGGGSGSGSESTGGGGSSTYTKYVTTYVKGSKSMNVFCGVPVWSDENENLHFGDVDPQSTCFNKYSESGEENIYANKTYDFFTYDITKHGIDTFQWPFTSAGSDGKGTLSNWWAGCEPICDMISKLLDDGFFFGKPWNEGIGHLFRKDVPTLVFVFSNEFDNAMSRNVNTYVTEVQQSGK